MRKTRPLLGNFPEPTIRFRSLFLVIAVFVANLLHSACCFGQGSIELEFFDKESGEPVSARIVFTKGSKKLSRPRTILFSGEQWLAEKKVPLSPSNGEFEFSVLRGPEFKEISGGFTIEPRAKDSVPVEIPRAIDMHAEHWFSGDHLSSLHSDELIRWQLADAVDLAVSAQSMSSSKANQSKPYNPKPSKGPRKRNEPSEKSRTDLDGLGLVTAGHYLEWDHGSVLMHGPQLAPSQLAHSKIDGADALKILFEAKGQDDILAELVRPWSRDVPLMLSSDAIRSVQLLSSYNRPNGDDRLAIAKESAKGNLGQVQLTQGKVKALSDIFAPIDPDEQIRFKDARGVGKLSEYIFWQMLEAGLRLTPTAGSGFNGNETQVGYNRVYVYSETTPDEAAWWKEIAQSHTFVTNGPLLRASINGLPPGSTQTSYRSQRISLDIAVSLAVRDPVDYLDVVFNGETIYSAKLEDHYKRGEFPAIDIDKSGWLVIRVVTEHSKGYRYATTAPFYFVFGGNPRVSRKAVSFFQKWQKAAVDSIAESPNALKRYEAWIERSDQFWESRMHESNSE